MCHTNRSSLRQIIVFVAIYALIITSIVLDWNSLGRYPPWGVWVGHDVIRR